MKKKGFLGYRQYVIAGLLIALAAGGRAGQDSWNDCVIQQPTGKGTGADGSRTCRRNAETGR